MRTLHAYAHRAVRHGQDEKLTTFDDIIAQYGTGQGCEICKPAITSMLASLWNEPIMRPKHQTLQDTNDRFLANMQRGACIRSFHASRVEKLALTSLSPWAKQRKNLASTQDYGGQRIDLFGAQVQDLPDIWEKLVNVGFESGHAYGKALRTIKSCVGTTWCRYGVQDSVGLPSA